MTTGEQRNGEGDGPAGGTVGRLVGGYGGGGEMPIGGYAVLMAAYGAAFGGLLAAAARGRRLPSDVATRDLVILGVATHKLSRIVTKDWVTSPVRAPFTEYRESLGSGEVAESSRGRGLRRAIGDLLTCPWCIGPWIAGSLTAGLVVAPRATRLVAGTFAAVTISDFLHHAYGAVRKLAE
jgi:hypothetical protein